MMLLGMSAAVESRKESPPPVASLRLGCHRLFACRHVSGHASERLSVFGDKGTGSRRGPTELHRQIAIRRRFGRDVNT
jgi:hypothetical protein